MPFEIGIKDIIDIFLVALMLYYVFKLMRESWSINIFYGVLVVIFIWLCVSQVLEMKLLGSILDKFISVGVIALVILFQQEIRKFLYTLGTQDRFRVLKRWFSSSQQIEDKKSTMPLVLACLDMGKKKVGALIVIEQSIKLHDIIDSGEKIDANINQLLIENIFFKNSPLHDGAMVISDKRIKAAGCILPVSHNVSIPKELGLRHRAALGISQQSDAIAIIVSEETGRISLAKNGEFKLRLSAEELEQAIANALK